MTTAEIVPYAAEPLESRMDYARTLSSAGDLIPRGLFGPPMDGKPPAPSPGKVLLVLETGAMLGLHPVAALSGINVIEGKPAASAALMSAVIRGAGHRLDITEEGSIEHGDYKVTATLTRRIYNQATKATDEDGVFTSTWTPQRAARAGLCTYAAGDDGVWKVTARSAQGKPLPWESYTESLCKARAVSEVARDGAQDVLSGVRYTPEELGATVDERGDVTGPTEAEAPQAEPAAKPARKRPTVGTQGTKRATEPTPGPDAAEGGAVAYEGGVLVSETVAEGSKREDIVDAEVVEEEFQVGPEATDEEAHAGTDTTEPITPANLGPSAEDIAREDAEEEERVKEAARLAFEAAEAEEAARAASADEGQAAVLDDGPAAAEVFDLTTLEGLAREAASKFDLIQLRKVWDEATRTGKLTPELQALIIELKTDVERKAAEAARAATEG